MALPAITYPTFDFADVITGLSGAITAVVVPALPFLVAAAALTGAVGWIMRKGKSAAKLR